MTKSGKTYLLPQTRIPISAFANARILNAICFACEAHDGAYRKYSKEPYVTHPINVAMQVYLWGGCEESIIAALLHDVVEDVEWATIDLIRLRFGECVANIVNDLTDVSLKSEDGNRQRRKLIDAQHASQGCLQAKLIKKADIKHNTARIHLDNPKFAQVYINEKWLQLHAIWTNDTAFAFEEVKAQLLDAASFLGVTLPTLSRPHKVIIPKKS